MCVRCWTHLGRYLRNIKALSLTQSQLRLVTVFHGSGSYLTTFVKGSPPRNGFNYVKTGAVLMPSKWGCGGQKVLDGGPIT